MFIKYGSIWFGNQFVSTLTYIWLIFKFENRKFVLKLQFRNDNLCGNILIQKLARGNFFTFLMSDVDDSYIVTR